MKYLYYPGCSLKGTGRAYEESTLAVFEALGEPLEEIPDWNCCGATAYMAIDEGKALAVAARNLAIAEQAAGAEPVSLVAPCNACFLVLTKAQRYLEEGTAEGQRIIKALAEGGLTYEGRAHVRHPLDVIAHDIGLDRVKDAVKRPLGDLNIACYYGCQVVRPFADFDDQYNPMTMDHLLRACGANTVDWPLKARCCGGALMGTIDEVGMRLSYIILHEATRRGAQTVATACPLCQHNLECYQPPMNRRFDDDLALPVAYFTQLLGRALGIDDQTLGIQRLFTPLTHSAAPSNTVEAHA